MGAAPDIADSPAQEPHGKRSEAASWLKHDAISPNHGEPNNRPLAKMQIRPQALASKAGERGALKSLAQAWERDLGREPGLMQEV